MTAIMVAFSKRVITHSSIALVVAMRSGCPFALAARRTGDSSNGSRRVCEGAPGRFAMASQSVQSYSFDGHVVECAGNAGVTSLCDVALEARMLPPSGYAVDRATARQKKT